MMHYVDVFFHWMVTEKRIDASVEKNERKVTINGKDFQMIDLNNIRNKDVREIGDEWLCYQAIRKLHIGPFLESLGWDEDQVRLTQTPLIRRTVYPASGLTTSH
ncbi:MAG: hypothetical protein Q8J88_02640 [Bacteroidales bacterium]|nr:hypothetical protein [Bacteroidales bacterium]